MVDALQGGPIAWLSVAIGASLAASCLAVAAFVAWLSGQPRRRLAAVLGLVVLVLAAGAVSRWLAGRGDELVGFPPPEVSRAAGDPGLPGPHAVEVLHHFGVHVRCLLAIPLFILAEGSLHHAAQHILAQFRSSGVVSPELRDRFDAAIAGVRRLRDASLPWVFVFGAAIAWTVVDQPTSRDDSMSWAIGADGSLGLRRPVVRLCCAAHLSRAAAGLAVAHAACRVVVLEGRQARPGARSDPSRPHGRNRLRREGAGRLRNGDIRRDRGDRVAVGARHRVSRCDAAVVQASRRPVRRPVDAAGAAATAGARARADRGARPRHSRLCRACRRAGPPGPPTLDSAAKRFPTRRSSTHRRSGLSPTPMRCTTR